MFRRQSDKSLIYIKKSNGPAQGDEIDIEIDGVKSKKLFRLNYWDFPSMIDSLRQNTLTKYPEKCPLIYRRFKKSTTFIYPSIYCLSVRPNNTAVQI